MKKDTIQRDLVGGFMKKSKKGSNNIAFISKLVVIVLAIAAFALSFAPFVKQTTWATGNIVTDYSLSGFVQGFGATSALKAGESAPEWAYFLKSLPSASIDGTITYTIASNIGMMITLILFIVGFGLGLISLLFKGKKNGKIGACVLSLAGLCLIAGGIMCFIAPIFGGFESSLVGIDTTIAGNSMKTGVEYSLGIGAIISAIASILGGVVGLGSSLFSLKK